MSSSKVRHLVAKKNGDGTLRFYWQPSSELRRQGWKPERLSDEYEAALARAHDLNFHVDQVRRGDFVGPTAAPPTRRAPFPQGRRPQGGASGVYVIGAGDDEPVKVGIAVDVAGRLLQLQTGSPRKLRVLFYCVCPFDDAVRIERQLLDAFVHDRVAGEWVARSARDVITAVLALFHPSKNSRLDVAEGDFDALG